eukprot:3563106-Prymnesium_polylepis.1
MVPSCAFIGCACKPTPAQVAARVRSCVPGASDTTGTQEGTVPHRDRPARFPWSLGETQARRMQEREIIRLTRTRPRKIDVAEV